MADENTGAVEYTGQNRVICDEAAGYTVKNADGDELDAGTGSLETGYVVEGIPESQLGRWLLNAKFSPVGDAAEKTEGRLKRHLARRINGVLVDQEEGERVLEEREEEGTPLVELSRERLAEIAQQEGVEVPGNARKSALIAAIEESREGSAGDPVETTANPPQPPPEDGTITE